jgi:hypothetical protein
MSLGKVEEHCRIAAGGNDPPGRRIRLEPMLFEKLLPRHTLHAILSIEHVVSSTVGSEDGWRGIQLLEATSGLLATGAIAGAGQNRPADGLQFHLAASAYRGEVFMLFLVHGGPFVGPVCEFILASVRNVCNGFRVCASVRRHARYFRSYAINGHRETGPAGLFRAVNGSRAMMRPKQKAPRFPLCTTGRLLTTSLCPAISWQRSRP